MTRTQPPDSRVAVAVDRAVTVDSSLLSSLVPGAAIPHEQTGGAGTVGVVMVSLLRVGTGAAL